jgi:AraC-like DNA-binding protein
MEPALLAIPSRSNSFAIYSVVREGQAADSSFHVHDCGQLIYPERGAILLETPDTLVRLAPDRATWIPAQLPHSVLMDRSFRYHSLYIDSMLHANRTCRTFAVKPLLRELILDASSWSADNLAFTQRHRKALVIVDELNRAPVSSTGIQIPDDRRIAPICREIEQDPSINHPIDVWAQKVGASEKTIQRAFAASTGKTFQQWRQHVRMTRALELHARGFRLLDIALAVGYATEGAYAQAFKKFYGHPPSRLRGRKV